MNSYKTFTTVAELSWNNYAAEDEGIGYTFRYRPNYSRELNLKLSYCKLFTKMGFTDLSYLL